MISKTKGLVVVAVLAAAALTAALAAMSAAGGSSVGWQAKVDGKVLRTAANGRTQFVVYLRERADLRGAEKLGWKARGQFVYDRLRANARESQRPLLAELREHGVPYRAFWVSNLVWVQGDLAAVRLAASRPEVAHVYSNGVGRIPERGQTARQSPAQVDRVTAVGNNIVKVNADDAWALGFRGQGAVVASADTGVRWTHESLKAKYRGWTGTTAIHDYNWKDGLPSADPANPCPAPSPQPCDDDELLGGGHGTHTTGTMVGSDPTNTNQTGMAPDAKWVACRNMHRGLGVIPTYMTCMQWFIAPTTIAGTSPRPDLRPHVVNNSWGCVEACPPPALRDVLQASRAAGIFYAVSAGNDGVGDPAPPPARGCATIQNPLARYPESFTVGATEIPTDAIADFSSRGPTTGEPDAPVQIKPNISAPGVDVRSSLAGTDSEYGLLDGTSMAGPHVAGLVALLISAKPSLAGQVDTLENIIEQSALHLTSNEGCGGDSATAVPNNTYGWGRIDALAAVNLAIGTPTAASLTAFSATPARGYVSVRWRTAAVPGHLGYAVWRSTTTKGVYRKLTRALIPARTAGLAAAEYRYVDRRAQRGRTYHYRLQLVGLSGRSSWSRTVSATAR